MVMQTVDEISFSFLVCSHQFEYTIHASFFDKISVITALEWKKNHLFSMFLFY